MKLSTRNLLHLYLAGGLLFGLSAGSHAEEPGVVRIAKPLTAQPSTVQPARFVENVAETMDEIGDSIEAPEEYYPEQSPQVRPVGQRRFFAGRNDDCEIEEWSDCPDCQAEKKRGRIFRRFKKDDCETDGWECDCPECQSKKHRFFGKGNYCPICGGCHRGTGCHHDAFYYFACKFGCLFPTGNGGVGAPLHGHYSRVYPQDVYYSDPRDGQLWAAQGYGVPIAVPLAPTVGHAYNYSWGIPASRLTPISNVAPR